MLNKFKEIFGKTDDVLRKYPMVLLMALLGAISLICFAHRNFDSVETNFVFVKFTMVCCLGISLMFALKMLSQRIGRAIVLEVFGVLFLIFFYFLLPEKKIDFTEKYAFLIIPTFILSHLLVSFIAFFGEKGNLIFGSTTKIFLSTPFSQEFLQAY